MINIGIRFIHDKENNKSYISIDGKIEEASQGEKEEIKDALSEAFSKILGLDDIEAESFQAQIIDDFKPIDYEDTIPEFLKEVMEEEAKNKEVEKEKEKAIEEVAGYDWKKEFDKMESIKLGFGRNARLTPFQIIAKMEDKGIGELNNLRKICERNLSRFPINEEKIKEIDRALKMYEKLKKGA